MRQCGRGNALNGATFISTVLYNGVAKDAVCVNALNGATFISTQNKNDFDIMKEMCQCPEWGDLHFYALVGAISDTGVNVVSMP